MSEALTHSGPIGASAILWSPRPSGSLPSDRRPRVDSCPSRNRVARDGAVLRYRPRSLPCAIDLSGASGGDDPFAVSSPLLRHESLPQFSRTRVRSSSLRADRHQHSRAGNRAPRACCAGRSSDQRTRRSFPAPQAEVRRRFSSDSQVRASRTAAMSLIFCTRRLGLSGTGVNPWCW